MAWWLSDFLFLRLVCVFCAFSVWGATVVYLFRQFPKDFVRSGGRHREYPYAVHQGLPSCKLHACLLDASLSNSSSETSKRFVAVSIDTATGTCCTLNSTIVNSELKFYPRTPQGIPVRRRTRTSAAGSRSNHFGLRKSSKSTVTNVTGNK